MEFNEEKGEWKFDELVTHLKEYGLNQSDLDILIENGFEEISEEVNEILKKLNITKEEALEIFIEYQGNNIYGSNSKEHKKSKDENEEPKDRDRKKMAGPEKIVDPRKEIKHFLHERSLSRSFVDTFLKVGFTEEMHRLLCAMGFTNEDANELRGLWELEMKSREEIDSCVSIPSSSDDYLSSDGIYLKNLLSKPLRHALREIVAKKPFDPIEYLGHWLLNYKICEERERKRKELELELMIERERLRIQKKDEEEEVPLSDSGDEEEEEEFFDNWSFINDK